MKSASNPTPPESTKGMSTFFYLSSLSTIIFGSKSPGHFVHVEANLQQQNVGLLWKTILDLHVSIYMGTCSYKLLRHQQSVKLSFVIILKTAKTWSEKKVEFPIFQSNFVRMKENPVHYFVSCYRHITPQEWDAHSRYNRARAESEMQASLALRGAINQTMRQVRKTAR